VIFAYTIENEFPIQKLFGDAVAARADCKLVGLFSVFTGIPRPIDFISIALPVAFRWQMR
jgi:hypothetical protein